MKVSVRELGAGEIGIWAQFAHALWPEDAVATHLAEIRRMSGPGVGGRRGFVAELDGERVGFAEMGLRPYANGCESQPVAFLEGIWVARSVRRRGIGRALVEHLEAVARAEGLSEIGSDALLRNRLSHASHRAWGFEEIERVVCYRKAL